jgi:biotin carboxyl carrier protein
MGTITIGGNSYQVKFNQDTLLEGQLNKKGFEWDLKKTGPGSFHIIMKNKSYSAYVAKVNLSNHTMEIVVNKNSYSLTFSDRFVEIMKVLGLEKRSAERDNFIKAPMPGLVLEIPVKVNQKVNMNDTVIILEAMKMENNIKSPKDGTIKKCLVKKGVSVEKDQVLITLK